MLTLRIKKAILLIPAISLLLAATACNQLEYYRDLTDISVEGDRVYISGTLNALTYDEFADTLTENPDLQTVVLENIDGSIDDEVNLRTGLLIHEAGLDTYLPSDGSIASGAVDLFCAGINRTVERGAHVGVHSWADEVGATGDTLPRNSEEHEMYVDYFSIVGCPASFYWFSLKAAPSDDMHMMTEQELLAHGVATNMAAPSK